MPLHRLFVALPPPATAVATIMGWMGPLPGARWQDEDQLHCTVSFLGELDRHAANDVAAALAGLSVSAIDARTGDLGTFASNGRIHSLWVGIAPISALQRLNAKVARRIVEAGIAPDVRRYQPHITLARFSRSEAPHAATLARLAPLPVSDLRFDRLVLYESHLDRTGARYEPVLEVAMQARSTL